MAGYIITLDNLESLQMYIREGVYSTKLSTPRGHWKIHHEGTFADYATMKQGDNVYFFIARKIYGIGELVNIQGDCKFLNFPEAAEPEPFAYETQAELLLWDEGDLSIDQRFICTFKPAPHFFRMGVDMDEVLSSNPDAFKMLRALWKVSFIKFDDVENQAFKDVILKCNQDSLAEGASPSYFFQSRFEIRHAELATRHRLDSYRLSADKILDSCASGDSLGHEMALEAGLLYQIANGDPETLRIFHDWDYISHQVVASPFKPIDYMDKMDVFGYRYISQYRPTKSKYLVAELKKDDALQVDIDQILKYVDWIKNEYCFGDYSMIEAFIIAHSFPEAAKEYARDVAVRKYTVGMKPASSREWKELRLIRYTFDADSKRLRFSWVNE